jgi:hypothetical protein
MVLYILTFTFLAAGGKKNHTHFNAQYIAGSTLRSDFPSGKKGEFPGQETLFQKKLRG